MWWCWVAWWFVPGGPNDCYWIEIIATGVDAIQFNVQVAAIVSGTVYFLMELFCGFILPVSRLVSPLSAQEKLSNMLCSIAAACASLSERTVTRLLSCGIMWITSAGPVP